MSRETRVLTSDEHLIHIRFTGMALTSRDRLIFLVERAMKLKMRTLKPVTLLLNVLGIEMCRPLALNK